MVANIIAAMTPGTDPAKLIAILNHTATSANIPPTKDNMPLTFEDIAATFLAIRLIRFSFFTDAFLDTCDELLTIAALTVLTGRKRNEQIMTKKKGR